MRADDAVMSVGIAEVDITPDYPVRLSGFGGRRTESDGVTLKIWAKSLAFADEKEGPAILITTENVAVSDEITSEVARRLAQKIGLKRERLTVTVTHTHTAPMLKNICPTIFGVPIPPEHQKNIDRYTVEFTDALEKVALQAWQNVKPSRLSWAMGTADFAANRRTKNGPVDHDLCLLAVRDLDGKLRGIYFSYACHCVTLSHNKISGDWAGFAQAKIQELFPGAIALGSVGCGADSNPNSGVTGGKIEICIQQGDQIAREVKRLVDTALKPIRSKPELHYSRVDLPLAKARSRAEWEARARQQDAVGNHARVNLARLDRGETLPNKINYPVQTWVFGEDLAIVFLPGETVVDYSLRLKRQFDRARLWVNGYSNDSRCYVPSERILKEGGYEGEDAMIYYDFPQKFAPGLEQILIDAVAGQIPASYRPPPGTEGTRPLSPQEALGSFRTKPGLRVELVASEPLIQAPVAIDWGADGKLWVCEMNDYPTGMDQNWQPGGRVKLLVDDNGDGQYDRATLFLDKIPFPTGVTAWGRGVLICAAPDIIYAEDTNNDGKADKIEKLFTGFFTDNYQARVNSLNLGLDNWIYGANGLLGGEIKPLKNSVLAQSMTKSVNIRNRDFRFDPVSGMFQTVSGLTQQGRVRDDWGNWFGCNNSVLVLHYPLPEYYLARNPHVPAGDPARDLTARQDGNRVFPTSPLLERFNDPSNANQVTSGCGLGIYRDTLLGDDFFGNAFTCEPVHNLVHREILTRNLIFSSQRAADEQDSEFLSSRDNWFRPVQARPGPDGALYIVDMYRFLIEHPRWIPAERLAQIDVRAGSNRGRIYRVVPTDKQLRPIRDLTQLNASQLVEALDTPNGIDRDRVQIELLRLKDNDGLPRLKELATKAALPQVRLQALSALQGLQALSPAQIQLAMRDSEPAVRELALRFAESLLRKDSASDSQILQAALKLQGDSSLVVLRQLAFTLGESSSPEAGRALAELARAWLSNLEMRRAIISSASRHCGAILQAVLSTENSAPGRADWIPPLVATAANSSDPKLVVQAIRSALPPVGATPGEGQIVALATLIENVGKRGTLLEDLLDHETKERIASARAAALKIAADESAAESVRSAAIHLIGQGPSDESLKFLCKLASDPAESIRRTAISSLKPLRTSAVAAEILGNWGNASPTARTELVALLLDREEWTVALLTGVRDHIVQPQQFTLADRQRLASSDKPQVRKLARELLPIETTTGRAEIVAKYKAAATLNGSPARGAEIFTKNCSSCHALNGIGQSVGPDLAALRPRDPEYWIKNILDPNAVIEPRFINYQIELKDERSLSGLIRNENSTSLTIVSGSGVTETILRSAVASIRASALSLMPEGLEQGIDLNQMADLISFAKSGKAAKQIAGNTLETIRAGADGVMMLPAAKSEIYGEEITLESDFQNIGMWHGTDDQVVWTIDVSKAGAYKVFLDYACAAGSAGNKFILDIGDQYLRGTTTETGSDWSDYKQSSIGSIQLSSGVQKVVLRSEGRIRGALIDLRAMALAPSGKNPKWRSKSDQVTDEVLRDPASLARFILDPARPDSARNSAINANPQYAGALVKELTRDLTPGTPEEYARIPWIWRVAIACGKRNDPEQIKAVIDAALPQSTEALRDWQAVVLGGGIVNGISQRGLWPAERMQQILADDPPLASRWSRSLALAASMADDDKVPTGTRYDALRMIALRGWDDNNAQLRRYIAKGSDSELQMGAVSGLSDLNLSAATDVLIDALQHLEGHNRELAVDGLLRDKARKKQLLKAIDKGAVTYDPTISSRLTKTE